MCSIELHVSDRLLKWALIVSDSLADTHNLAH